VWEGAVFATVPYPDADTLDVGTRYAWVAGLFLALTVTTALSRAGIPPFAVKPAAHTPTPRPTVTPFSRGGGTPHQGTGTSHQGAGTWHQGADTYTIAALEDMTDEQMLAFLENREGASWPYWEDSHRQLLIGGVAVPADHLAVDLTAFPRPPGDNGRGIHWIPTTHQSPAVVDRYIDEVRAMDIKWVVLLNGLEDYELTANDYLVRKLVASGIQPVMRLESRVQPLDAGRVAKVVTQYRPLGVHYYQIFNEPNLHREWGEGGGHQPERFADLWADAAMTVLANGGLPGLAAMSPSGDTSDYEYLARSLAHLVVQNRYHVLNRTWLSVHNYTGGVPVDFIGDTAGFGRYRGYAGICRAVLGTPLPMIGTEGGVTPADGAWPGGATSQQEAEWIAQAYDFMATRRESYLLVYSPWVLANFAGGGRDARWEAAAWFQVDGPRPVVAAVQ